MDKKKGSEKTTATPQEELLKCQQELRDAKTRIEFEVAHRTKILESEIARLEGYSRSKDEFIRVTSHELRTPLDVIRGNLDIVLKGEAGEVPKKMRVYLEDVLLGADRLTKLVNDMLDISRIETGRMKFTLEDIDLDQLLEKVGNEFGPLAAKKNVKLFINAPSNLPHVFSDSAKLWQILDNLIGNSLKFTPGGGSITIEAKTQNDMMMVSVRDTGIGIRPEDMGKLFKRFPQIESGVIQEIKGTGLGLFLVRQFIERLGGEIWTESAGLSKGTTFYFQIPRAGTARAEALARFHVALREIAES